MTDRVRIRPSAAAALCLAAVTTLAAQPVRAQEAPAAAQTSTAAQSGPAAQATVAAQTTDAAARPPVVNRVNDALPGWLRVRGELRERLEGFDGLGFDDAREDLYWLTRVRLDATVQPSRQLAFHVQAQDARVGKKAVGPTGAPFRAPMDLRQAYVYLGTSTSPLALRAGRQELVYGEQRLVGHVSWLNAARTFDGVKLIVRAPGFTVDLFGASVVRTLEDRFDRSGNGNRFAGAYVTSTVTPLGAVEPYVFWRRDTKLFGETGFVDDLNQTTTGIRLAGKLTARFDYGVEMALQRGSLGSDDVRAWAGHWQLRQTLPVPGGVRLTGEYNYASGDEDPADGVRGTFDQLYPTPHDKYGLADQIGWKNVHHARAGVEVTPFKGMVVTTNYHSWWLAERRDGIYTAGSAPLARIPAGAVDRHVGQEIDVQASKALFAQLQVAAGYAHIFPGAFLKAATPGASYSQPYVMVTYLLLAEQ